MKLTSRKGLFVSDRFTERFGEPEVTPSILRPYTELPENMRDAEILKKYGCQDTLEDIAALVQKPPEDVSKYLWYLFYVAGYIVDVDWYAGHGGWGVDAWGLDDRRWDAGSRVFSRNSPSESLPPGDYVTRAEYTELVEKLNKVLRLGDN